MKVAKLSPKRHPVATLYLFVVSPTQLKNMLVKLDHFPRVRVEHKKCLEKPPPIYGCPSCYLIITRDIQDARNIASSHPKGIVTLAPPVMVARFTSTGNINEPVVSSEAYKILG